jgi:transposase
MLFERNDFLGTAPHGYKGSTFVTTIDRQYYEQRAREEREREKTAATRSAALAHAELAEEYERLLRDFGKQPQA